MKLPPNVKPYEQKRFDKTRRQICNAIPVEGIEETLLAIKLGVSLVELRHALSVLAKEKIVDGNYVTHWDGETLQHYTYWRITL